MGQFDTKIKRCATRAAWFDAASVNPTDGQVNRAEKNRHSQRAANAG